MLLIRQRAFARAGVVGNPSDGYYGKTISLAIRDFMAQVSLYEWDELEIVQTREDGSRFASIHDLARDVRLHGYYGGIRLVKASIKKFAEYCVARNLPLHDQNFSIRYQSNIPRQVGLAGSSAIIVATMRALMQFYRIDIPREALPSLVLSVETDELGIAGGLQDRVAQVYEGLVYMDFAVERMRDVAGLPCGSYEPLDPALLPPVYLSYRADASEPTEVVHNNLKARYQQGEPAVLAAMRRLAELTVEARAALLAGDARRLAELIDLNFEQRRSICQIPAMQVAMVEVARRCGASAHFAGSGGAILGTYPDEATYQRLEKALAEIGCRTFKPTLVGD